MKINNILNEEISKFLNESISMEHENFKFSQNLDTATFNNYEGFSTDFDIRIENSNIIVNWHIIFWLNDFGVENFIINVDSLDGTYSINYLNKQTDMVEQTTDKNISEIPWKFNVNNAVLNLNGGLYVQSLDFDFKTNTCNVGF